MFRDIGTTSSFSVELTAEYLKVVEEIGRVFVNHGVSRDF